MTDLNSLRRYRVVIQVTDTIKILSLPTPIMDTPDGPCGYPGVIQIDSVEYWIDFTETGYTLERFQSQGEVGLTYNIQLVPYPVCSCKDYQYRGFKEKSCKHTQACEAVQLANSVNNLF